MTSLSCQFPLRVDKAKFISGQFFVKHCRNRLKSLFTYFYRMDDVVLIHWRFFQCKAMNPSFDLFKKLLWREFFFVVGSQVSDLHEMISNPVSLQIPWEEDPEHLEKWKQVRSQKKIFLTIN